MHEGTGQDRDVAGLSVEDAVDVLVERRTGHDREAARETLAAVAEEGVVTRAAAEDALAHASKVVATPETRVELAERALTDAREAAAPVADVDIVADRLDGYESELSTLEDRLGGLADDLGRLADSDDLVAVAVGVGRLRSAAGEVQTAADDLSMALETFERWLDDHEVRYRALDDDTEAVAAAVDDLNTTADALTDPDSAPGDRDPSVAWAVASMRHRSLSLMVADLRFELDGLATLDERLGTDAGPVREDCRERLERLGQGLDAIGDRLTDTVDAGARSEFGARVSAFEEEIDSVDPPVDWVAVQRAFEAHHEALDGR